MTALEQIIEDQRELINEEESIRRTIEEWDQDEQFRRIRLMIDSLINEANNAIIRPYTEVDLLKEFRHRRRQKKHQESAKDRNE